MKKLFILLALCPLLAQAAPTYDLNFPNPVKLSELARIVYGEILGENYIIEPALLKDDSTITSGISGMSQKGIAISFRELLERQGYAVKKLNGVNFIAKAKEEPPQKEVYFYRPHYRTANYITGLVSALFPDAHFSFQRQIKAPPTGMIADTAKQPPPQQQSDQGSSQYVDKTMDAFIFEGTPAEVARLKQLVTQIDVPGGEVAVKGLVFEVSTKAGEGTAFGLALNLLSGKIGLSAGLTKNLGNAITLHNAGSFGIDAIASALSTDSRFKVVSSPNLRVKSGATARFSAGSDVPVLGAVNLDRNGNPVQSIEYKPSGVILSIKPEVRESQIELNVQQQLSSFVTTTTGVNNSPTLNKREISTIITSGNDDYIILGGLTEEKSSNDRNGLSFIPDWLHSTGSESSKVEILLVLQVTKI